MTNEDQTTEIEPAFDVSEDWLILLCRTRSERVECERLAEIGVIADAPRIKPRMRSRYQKGRRPLRDIRVGRPLMPGFVFVRAPAARGDDLDAINLCRKHTAQRSRIRGYVAWTGHDGTRHPCRISDAQMRRIIDRAREESRREYPDSFSEAHDDDLTRGELVLVTVGGMLGQELVIAGVEDDRVTVEVELLGRSGLMSVAKSAIQKLEASNV